MAMPMRCGNIQSKRGHAKTCERLCSVQAMAAHNTGGLVIVQVERVVASGSLPARLVHIPGAIVDKVMKCLVPSKSIC